MLKANINEANPNQVVVAEGSVKEIANDIAVIIHDLYNQFKSQDTVTAELFRFLITELTKRGSPVWQPGSNITGISFVKPEEEEKNDG